MEKSPPVAAPTTEPAGTTNLTKPAPLTQPSDKTSPTHQPRRQATRDTSAKPDSVDAPLTPLEAPEGSPIVSANFTSIGQRTLPVTAFFELAALLGEAYAASLAAANDNHAPNESLNHE